jgi:predicted permease
VQKQIFEKLQNNPNLKKTVIVAGIIILVIILLLVILLFPVIMKLLGFVSENGVQGVLDALWKGTKQ